MIVKFFELKKKNLKEFQFFLLYGNNKGLIEETCNNVIKPIKNGNIFTYDENEVIKNIENFEETLLVKSFFDNEKLIIINRVTDKILKIIEKIIEKNLKDITLILTAGILEKKSKIRNFFEKQKELIIIPFYEDNYQSLNLLTTNFLKERNISLSPQNINLIIERCRGDRINLINELQKIESFSKNRKNIKVEDILKLTNLSENFNASELVDNTLAKNQKKTLYILNENNFVAEDSILILITFINKLKRLFKIQKEIKKNDKNIDEVISNFKPIIFWKEKDIVKKQINILTLVKLERLLIKINNLELSIKKNPSQSTNILTNFILEEVS
jgi:DNA polymerase-3 subunit delta